MAPIKMIDASDEIAMIVPTGTPPRPEANDMPSELGRVSK